MGFFSSRKPEDNDIYQVTVGLGGGGGGGNSKSVVKVIRSRFYGKKGKEREDHQPAVSFLGGVSAAQALSNNGNPTHASANKTLNRSESVLRTSNNNIQHSIPSTTLKRRPNDATLPSSPPSSRTKDPPTSFVTRLSSPLRQNTTDTVTVTLAQRLDELALANSEGLLNDDEYRLLRQNLFERFANNSAVPTEASVVPVASDRARLKNGRQTPERPPSRPSSNFQIDVPRPGSIDSRTSATSSVVNLFRRATGRRPPKEPSDTSSVWSRTSNNSNFFRLPPVLSKKSSNSSIGTNASRIQADTGSMSSRPLSDRGHGESPGQFAPRSTASFRHLTTPPSSFPTRIIPQDNRTINSIYNVFDEEHLKTVQEITQEIQNVEAEGKRLMDAFNGLEVTTLAKLQRHQIRPSLKSVDTSSPESHWGFESEGRSQRRIVLADDTISMRSGTSAGTTPSVSASLARSVHSTKRLAWATKPSSLAVGSGSKSGSLHRKNSTSSITSERKGGRTLPVGPNSVSHGYLKGANSSNISLSRSTGHLPMDTVLEDEKVSMSETVNTAKVEPEDIEDEMEDIRRRREEVSLRYEARLEYLQAKLKGAQLHEKLLRR
ncbi:hypothetical protein BYT27DRAFT_7150271 [Phlegmacium glaucopus]|nr:hypothetical protein BYT27DRAFT_7150271 [Phlegmacium glaucopus]